MGAHFLVVPIFISFNRSMLKSQIKIHLHTKVRALVSRRHTIFYP